MKIALCLKIVTILLSVLPQIAIAEWEQVAEGLEINRVAVWPGSVVSPELFFVRASLDKYRIGVVRAADFGLRNGSAKTLSTQANCFFGINGNFFDEHGKALGLVISRGIKHQPIHRGGKTLTGIFQIGQQGISIVNRADFDSRLVTEAIHAGPRLLSRGMNVPGLKAVNTYSRRAGVCLDKAKRVVFFISSGLMGITLQQVQDVIKGEEIACVDALNLDGGGSAQMYLSHEVLRFQNEDIFIQGRDNVPVVIGLLKR